MEGKFEQAKGRMKKAAGELTGNRRLKAEGTLDKASGKIKSGLNRAKRALNETTDGQ